MKQFHWLLCVVKNCDWSRKIAALSNLTRAPLLVKWKLTAKAELNCEIYKSWRKCRKNQVSFCHRSSPVSRKAWTLSWKLQELKKYPRKTCGCGQPRGHLRGLPRGVLMSLCRSFANPPVAFFFCYNTNVDILLNLCDAVSNFYNLLLFMPVSEDQQHIKAVANEDTLSRKHCCSWRFLARANWETFVADTKFVSATNVARANKRGRNICVGNNVSATMCPSLPVPVP